MSPTFASMKKIFPALLSIILAPVLLQAQTNLDYFYGNLHSHTSYSDGSMDCSTSGVCTPYQAYNFAKGSLHFDFLGISEHNHSTAGMLMPNYHLGMQQADSANEDGQFVALFGMEWGTISTGGHVLIYGCEDLLGWETGNYDTFVARGDYQNLWQEVNSRPEAFGMLCHPVNSDFNDLRNGPYNPSADAAVVGTAFRSGPAFSTDTSYSNQSNSSFEAYYRALLAKGYHVGPTHDHDNHNTTFGRHTEGRLVALAPTLTRDNLMQAFKARRFYASDDWNTEVRLIVNNYHTMGAILRAPSSPAIFFAYEEFDMENFTSLQVMKGRPGDGQQPQSIYSGPTGINNYQYGAVITDHDLQLGDSAYYYLSITQADGDRIITAPIWYTRGPLISSAPEELKPAPELMIWPNPANVSAGHRKVTISAPDTGELIVLDQLGREVSRTETFELNSTLQVEGLTPGLYFIMYTSDYGIPATLKLVVQ